jgi:hypothetical protein
METSYAVVLAARAKMDAAKARIARHTAAAKALLFDAAPKLAQRISNLLGPGAAQLPTATTADKLVTASLLLRHRWTMSGLLCFYEEESDSGYLAYSAMLADSMDADIASRVRGQPQDVETLEEAQAAKDVRFQRLVNGLRALLIAGSRAAGWSDAEQADMAEKFIDLYEVTDVLSAYRDGAHALRMANMPDGGIFTPADEIVLQIDSYTHSLRCLGTAAADLDACLLQQAQPAFTAFCALKQLTPALAASELLHELVSTQVSVDEIADAVEARHDDELRGEPVTTDELKAGHLAGQVPAAREEEAVQA